MGNFSYIEKFANGTKQKVFFFIFHESQNFLFIKQLAAFQPSKHRLAVFYSVSKECIWFFATETWWPKHSWTQNWYNSSLQANSVSLKTSFRYYLHQDYSQRIHFVQNDSMYIFFFPSVLWKSDELELLKVMCILDGSLYSKYFVPELPASFLQVVNREISNPE